MCDLLARLPRGVAEVRAAIASTKGATTTILEAW